MGQGKIDVTFEIETSRSLITSHLSFVPSAINSDSSRSSPLASSQQDHLYTLGTFTMAHSSAYSAIEIDDDEVRAKAGFL